MKIILFITSLSIFLFFSITLIVNCNQIHNDNINYQLLRDKYRTYKRYKQMYCVILNRHNDNKHELNEIKQILLNTANEYNKIRHKINRNIYLPEKLDIDIHCDQGI